MNLVKDGIIADNVNITLEGCYNGASPENILSNSNDSNKSWANSGLDNFAKQLSEALPNATITANKTQVNASQGLNAPVVYKNGKVVE